jgi:hypothetical protein
MYNALIYNAQQTPPCHTTPLAAACLQWWGARILRQTAPQPGVIGPCYLIQYDAEEGFEAEQRTIRIIGLRESSGGGGSVEK